MLQNSHSRTASNAVAAVAWYNIYPVLSVDTGRYWSYHVYSPRLCYVSVDEAFRGVCVVVFSGFRQAGFHSFCSVRCRQISLCLHMNKIEHTQSRQSEGSNNISASVFGFGVSTRSSLPPKNDWLIETHDRCLCINAKQYHFLPSAEAPFRIRQL